MRKFKDYLLNTLGVAGFIIWLLIGCVLMIFPLTVIEFPFWLNLIVIFVILSSKTLGNIVEIVLWVWSFIVIISEPIDSWSITYYIVCAIRFVPGIISFVVTLIAEGIERKERKKYDHSEWIEDVLNGGHLEPEDTSKIISSETLDMIIEEQSKFFNFDE